MATKKKVIKEKKQKKIKQKQKQSQSQKVIINLNEVKTKPKRTRKKSTNKNIKFNEISTAPMPEGWAKYGAQEREANTLRGNLNEVQNKLLTIKNVENPVNNDERNERIAKIEEGMKIMRIGGNNAFRDLYSKFDQIGDFTNKTKFKNPVKEEEKKQSQPIFIPNDEKQAPPFIINQSNYLENYKNVSPKKKTAGRPRTLLTEEEKKRKKSEENRLYREKAKAKKDKAKKEVEETESKNISLKDRIDKARATLKQQQQEADEKYDFQKAYLNEMKDTSTEKDFI
jgi:hypothetical protein